MDLLRELYLFNASTTPLLEQLTILQTRFDIFSAKVTQINEETDLGFSKNNMTLENLKINIGKLHEMLVNAFRGLDKVGELRDEAARNKHATMIGNNIKKIDARLKQLESEYHYFVTQRVEDIYNQESKMPAAPAAPEQQRRTAPQFSRGF